MIKIIKKKTKNPNLKGKEFIDDHFLELLFSAVAYNFPSKFQRALTYKNIGYELCEDCTTETEKHNYFTCKCENYIDDYNIEYTRCGMRGMNGYCEDETDITLINAVKLQFEYLSLPQLIKFRSKLININPKKDNKIKIHKSDIKKLIDEINKIIQNKNHR